VIDLGFAINRGIVYGSVSAILLASFGLIEWSIEHLLPEQWLKASAWFDAGAALLVYLAFHRMHGAIEHRVEHLFFRTWRQNEEALCRFVGTAPHFDDETTLARAFADELSRFAGEGRVALYRRNPKARDKGFTRMAGTWEASPPTLPGDDATYARMRTECRPIELGDARTDLPGVLALPMLDHGALAGLVLMDLKGSGGLFRPDEIAALGHAAHGVGLALAALRAGSIEAENRQLATENRMLKGQMTRLAGMLGERLKPAGV
jgi:GAF domain-containing protein